MTGEAMTRAFGVALLARPEEGARGPWRHVGRQPIGRLQVERMRQGYPSPELIWSDPPERIIVYGVVILDPSGEPSRASGFDVNTSIEPQVGLRVTLP